MLGSQSRHITSTIILTDVIYHMVTFLQLSDDHAGIGSTTRNKATQEDSCACLQYVWHDLYHTLGGCPASTS